MPHKDPVARREWEQGYRERTRDKQRVYGSDFRKRHPDRQRQYALKFLFGLTQAQFDEMLSKQDGKCGICRQPFGPGRKLMPTVDHDHSCCPGKRSCGSCIRGLLHGTCNSRLAVIEDGDYVAGAKSYLDQPR